MIKNEKQYKITKSRLKDFEKSLKICKEGKYPDKVIYKAMIDSLKSQMADLKKEIRDYEKLKNKQVSQFDFKSIKDLPDILIQARISHGYTQKQFAKRLNMPEQQIQRYEAENFKRVSLETLM
ncbi:MAG: helix-turn-helix domain-containing protein, partial [Nitrospinales bacterium]